jgi:hypothetical protein
MKLDVLYIHPFKYVDRGEYCFIPVGVPALMNLLREQGYSVVGVNLLPLIHGRWVAVVVKKKSKEMERMARRIEEEFLEEFGCHITIFIIRSERLASRFTNSA